MLVCLAEHCLAASESSGGSVNCNSVSGRGVARDTGSGLISLA